MKTVNVQVGILFIIPYKYTEIMHTAGDIGVAKLLVISVSTELAQSCKSWKEAAIQIGIESRS
jgi:hypothetical protein